MSNYKLIDQLTKDFTPVKPISPLRNTLLWTLLSLGFVAMAIMMMSRRQISDLLSDPIAIITTLWFLLNSVGLVFAINVAGIPGKKNQRMILSIAIGAYVLLIGILLGTVVMTKSSIALTGMECVVGVAMLSSMPLIFLFALVKKLAPTSPWLIGLLAGISACAFGAFGLAFSCTDDDPLHLLIFHLILPTILVGSISAIIGKKLIKW